MGAVPHCSVHLSVAMKGQTVTRKVTGYGGHVLRSKRVEYRCQVENCPVCVVGKLHEKHNQRGIGPRFARDDFY